MITILSVAFCIHTWCTLTIIPTPMTFTAHQCAMEGYYLALKESPKNWRVAAYFCEEGRLA